MVEWLKLGALSLLLSTLLTAVIVGPCRYSHTGLASCRAAADGGCAVEFWRLRGHKFDELLR